MEQPDRKTEASAPRAVGHKQCPYCGFNNPYDPDAGTPDQCEECEAKFADPMEARAAFDAMHGSGFWFEFRRRMSGYFPAGPAGRRLLIIGAAIGAVVAEIARRLWAG